MKLSMNMRELAIRAAMLDVPSVDHKSAVKDLMQNAAYVDMPATVKAVYDDIDTRHHLCLSNSIWSCGSSFRIYAPKDWAPRKSLSDEIERLEAEHEAQEKQRNELKTSLHAALAGCSTRQQAVTALPEFEKYLPPEPVRNLSNAPVVVNPIEQFRKAGFPKGASQG